MQFCHLRAAGGAVFIRAEGANRPEQASSRRLLPMVGLREARMTGHSAKFVGKARRKAARSARVELGSSGPGFSGKGGRAAEDVGPVLFDMIHRLCTIRSASVSCITWVASRVYRLMRLPRKLAERHFWSAFFNCVGRGELFGRRRVSGRPPPQPAA